MSRRPQGLGGAVGKRRTEQKLIFRASGLNQRGAQQRLKVEHFIMSEQLIEFLFLKLFFGVSVQTVEAAGCVPRSTAGKREQREGRQPIGLGVESPRPPGPKYSEPSSISAQLVGSDSDKARHLNSWQKKKTLIHKSG